MRYFCWKLGQKTAGVLGGLYFTGSQDGGNPTWPDLFSIKFGTKDAHKTTNSCTHRQNPPQSLHIYTKLVNNSSIIACSILFFFEFKGVPTPNLRKPREAATCCYVTSHWQWWVGLWQILKNNRITPSLLIVGWEFQVLRQDRKIIWAVFNSFSEGRS